MAASRFLSTIAMQVASHRNLWGAVFLTAAVCTATAQVQAQQPQAAPEARVIVIGEGSVHVPPDYARIRSGVTTRAKTVKEASEANSKLMGAITATLLGTGIAQKDIQTSRFSIQPVYTPPQPQAEPKLSGYSVSNQVVVTIRQISKVGDILDHLVTAGVTDVGDIAFLLSDPSKALDQAREAAVADARRKGELYARASGVSLGRVAWITEDSGYAPSIPIAMSRAQATMAAPAPIASGEDTLEARITVGYDIVR